MVLIIKLKIIRKKICFVSNLNKIYIVIFFFNIKIEKSFKFYDGNNVVGLNDDDDDDEQKTESFFVLFCFKYSQHPHN